LSIPYLSLVHPLYIPVTVHRVDRIFREELPFVTE